MNKAIFLPILSIFLLLNGCGTNSPVPNSQQSVEDRVANGDLITQDVKKEKVEELKEEESNPEKKKLNTKLGAELLQNLIEYYRTVDRVRRAGYENASSKDADLLQDFRKSINTLIEDGADVNYRDNDGNTPIYIATLNDDKQILSSLIEKKADITTKTPQGYSLLSSAIRKANLDSAYTLLENGADPDGYLEETEKPLYLATIQAVDDNAFTALGVKLLKAGAEPNNRGRRDEPLLLTVIKLKNSEIGLALLEAKADFLFIDSDGISILNWAIILRENEIAKYIIDRSNEKSLQNETTLSPLALAIITHNQEIFTYLKDNKGIKVNKNNKGAAALQLASILTNEEIEKLLNGEKIPALAIKPTVKKDAVAKKSMAKQAPKIATGKSAVTLPLPAFPFLSIDDKDEEIKIYSDDKLLKKFILEKPLRVVLDFNRFSGADNLRETLNGKYLKKVAIGRHDGFYRVVLYMENSKNIKIIQESDGIKVVVKR